MLIQYNFHIICCIYATCYIYPLKFGAWMLGQERVLPRILSKSLATRGAATLGLTTCTCMHMYVHVHRTTTEATIKALYQSKEYLGWKQYATKVTRQRRASNIDCVRTILTTSLPYYYAPLQLCSYWVSIIISVSFKLKAVRYKGNQAMACIKHRLCTHYINDFLPYTPLQLCSSIILW
jgi:hypothetical protein